MVPLETAFLGLILFFALVGALRGWARELLVIFSVILERFIEIVLKQYVPVIGPTLTNMDPRSWFYVRLIIFILIVFFGYATPVLSPALGAKARKDKFQDTLLGLFIGLVNGILVMGTFWGFLHELGYGIWEITAPTSDTAMQLLEYLPTMWLDGPFLFVAVAASFAFVLIVFV
ncbi:MAG: CvpA family protein [Anaerolineae bacterium]|nr:CvpA family protein [Anaerolineae bacterium]